MALVNICNFWLTQEVNSGWPRWGTCAGSSEKRAGTEFGTQTSGNSAGWRTLPNGVDRGGGFGEIMCSGLMGRARRRRLYEEDHEVLDHPKDHLSVGKIPGSRRPRIRGSFFQQNRPLGLLKDRRRRTKRFFKWLGQRRETLNTLFVIPVKFSETMCLMKNSDNVKT